MLQPQEIFLRPTEQLRNLYLLEEIAHDATISQRRLAHSLGIGLGVANACLRKMAKKGYIKVKGINHRRIGYYLTPKGISEKARLTYHFLQHTVNYYVGLKKAIAQRLTFIADLGISRILYYGAGEVMEIALIGLSQTNLQLIAIVDDAPEKQGKRIFGFEVQSPEAIEGLDIEAILITSLRYKDDIYRNIKENIHLRDTAVYFLGE